MAEDFFYRLGKAAGMAKQAIQKTTAQEFDGIQTLSGHGQISVIVNEKPDGTRIVLLKAKGADSTVYVGFDRDQLDAFQAKLAEIKI